MSDALPVFYNCNNCPAYCCSYPHTPVNKTDLRRLARHFDIDLEVARRRFTKRGASAKAMVLRQQKDDVYGSACRFLDAESRQCTVYEARPKICREHPGSVRCGYYDFLCAERHLQEDPELAATAYNV
jgi:Fe-S-cluster containining protein